MVRGLDLTKFFVRDRSLLHAHNVKKSLAQGGVVDILISVELGLQFDQALFDGKGRLPDHLQCSHGRADVPRHARCKCTNWLGVGDSDQKQTLEKV